MTPGLRLGAAPAAASVDGSAPGDDRCVIRVRHHWAVRAILHAPIPESRMADDMASIDAERRQG
jgi:hypothetical protein